MIIVTIQFICDRCNKINIDAHYSNMWSDVLVGDKDGWGHDRNGNLLCPECLKELGEE